jgi:hypothetical protein
MLPRLIYFREASSTHLIQNDKLAYSSETKIIDAKNGDYGYDMFLICNRTIIKF